jgi:hypothetical protein
VDCYYYSSDGKVAWGLGSANEMCIDFLYYYPRYREHTSVRTRTYAQAHKRISAHFGTLSRAGVVCTHAIANQAMWLIAALVVFGLHVS